MGLPESGEYAPDGPPADRRRAFWLVTLLGVAARLAVVMWAGNAPQTPLTGGSDTLPYQTLADNLAHHRGFTYAGFPSAIRAPLYPLFLSLMQGVAGDHYRIFVRLIQFLAGIAIALLCARTSQALGGNAQAALAAALLLPTQIFFQAEILTETFATLLVAAFFFAILTKTNPLVIGAIIGIGMLERFNLANLALVYPVFELAIHGRKAMKPVAAAAGVACLLIAPWIARNLIAFDGRAVYSTDSGITLVAGLVAPDGRIQGEDWGHISALSGWTTRDIETNDASRTAFPPEPDLDRSATLAAWKQWKNLPASALVALAVRKLGYFWLSLDQVFGTQYLSPEKRFERLAGVIVCWIFLGFAIRGWLILGKRNPGAALFFALFVVMITALHLPFTMGTRIRTPFVDPLLVILVGVSFALAAVPAVDRRCGNIANL